MHKKGEPSDCSWQIEFLLVWISKSGKRFDTILSAWLCWSYSETKQFNDSNPSLEGNRQFFHFLSSAHKTSRMHWRARRTCLAICLKRNRGVLWQEDWETQRILDSRVCLFGLDAQRPTWVAEDIRVRQNRDLRRLWLKLWPIKPRCPADPSLSSLWVFLKTADVSHSGTLGHLKPSRAQILQVVSLDHVACL